MIEITSLPTSNSTRRSTDLTKAKGMSQLMEPETRYARSGEFHIAYQAFGRGSVDLVLVPGFISNLEETWEDPSAARWLERFGRFARVIAFDKRGTGLSDRVELCRASTSGWMTLGP